MTGKIEHFCARRMMNIDGIGEETTELLFDCGLVKNIADLYDLKYDNLLGLDKIGEKTANRIIDGIEASKSVPFERVIYALSIPNVGETTAKRIAKAVKSIDNMQMMSEEELTAIPDVGQIIAKSIYDFLRDPINIDIIARLKQAGIQMELSQEKLSSLGDALVGKIIVISGTFCIIPVMNIRKLLNVKAQKIQVVYLKRPRLFLQGIIWVLQKKRNVRN